MLDLLFDDRTVGLAVVFLIQLAEVVQFGFRFLRRTIGEAAELTVGIDGV